MELAPSKILLIATDVRLVQVVTEMLRQAGAMDTATVTVPTLEAGEAQLAENSVQAVLLELGAADKTALLNVSSLTTRAPKVAVLACGPVEDEAFAEEVVRAGAQDYLVKSQLDAHALFHTFRCAIERQRNRVALLAAEENYRGIFDHLVEGIFRTTPDGHYLMANAALARIYGYDSPDELTQSITDIAQGLYVQPGRRDDFIRLMQEQDTVVGFESQIYRKDGAVIWISENCRAVRDARGQLRYYEGTVEDVTSRKRAEDQVRAATTELARSREELRTKNLMVEENLRMAREIQLAMLSQQPPAFPRNATPEQNRFLFTHRYHAAESVSGDFFSISALSDEEAAILICDVTGKGVRAGLVTAMIRALSEELKPLAHDPGMFLRKLNSDLCTILKSTGSPTLTTAFYLTANWRTGVLRYANAGHPKPLRVRRSAGQVDLLTNASGKSQPALGLFDDPAYQTTEKTLAPGDLVMLFTDGLYEVQGQNEELYSQERLILDVKSRLAQPTGQLFNELLDAIRAFSVDHEFSDDVCIVGMELTPASSR